MEEESHQPKVNKDTRKDELIEWIFNKIGSIMNCRGKAQVESM